MKMRTRERLGSTKIQDGGVIRLSCECETEEAFINFEFSENLSYKIFRLVYTWNEVTILWNKVTIWWNEVTKGWNEVAWNEVVMEQSDCNSWMTVLFC